MAQGNDDSLSRWLRDKLILLQSFDSSWNIFSPFFFFFLEVKDFNLIYNTTNSVYNTLQFQKVKDPRSMESLCQRGKNYKRKYTQ